jgi:hypothetical protein
LLFLVSGASFISKKIKEQGFLRKSHQKTHPLDPGSGKNSSRIRIQGVKKHQIPDPDPQHCGTYKIKKIIIILLKNCLLGSEASLDDIPVYCEDGVLHTSRLILGALRHALCVEKEGGIRLNLSLSNIVYFRSRIIIYIYAKTKPGPAIYRIL